MQVFENVYLGWTITFCWSEYSLINFYVLYGVPPQKYKQQKLLLQQQQQQLVSSK